MQYAPPYVTAQLCTWMFSSAVFSALFCVMLFSIRASNFFEFVSFSVLSTIRYGMVPVRAQVACQKPTSRPILSAQLATVCP